MEDTLSPRSVFEDTLTNRGIGSSKSKLLMYNLLFNHSSTFSKMEFSSTGLAIFEEFK